MIWSFVLAVVGIAGIYLAGKKSKWGWGLGLGAQVLWLIFALVTAQYGFILTALAYGAVYGKNLYQWHKDEEPLDKKDLSKVPTGDEVYYTRVYAFGRESRSTLETCNDPDKDVAK